jgi:hypothetical protein
VGTIVDANCCTLVLCKEDANDDFAPLRTAIVNGQTRITIGGAKFRTEYIKLKSVWRFVMQLDRAGRVFLVSDAKVDADEQSIVLKFQLKSDDPHILALARVSGSRLLCSNDQNLHADFLNKDIVDKPRGSIYQNASHAHLIRKHP